MKSMIVLGLLLILLGIAILYEWVNYRTASGIFESAQTSVP